MRIMEDPAAERSVSPLYLGLDFSTQQLKAVSVGEDLTVTHEFSVVYDKDLPEFKTEGGVHHEGEDHSVTAPTLMWVQTLSSLPLPIVCTASVFPRNPQESRDTWFPLDIPYDDISSILESALELGQEYSVAWDLLLDRMHAGGFPFCRVVCVGGSGQQHGSVYWKNGSCLVLAHLSPSQPLSTQLKSCFSVPASPVWMDSSTGAQCEQLEARVGGAQHLAERTGSRAYERFTGNQIAKIHQQASDKEAYRGFSLTERISLVSSFGATLLLGRYAEIDYSDGSGMNLMDLRTKDWWPEALDACAPGLGDLLGQPVPTNTSLGFISSYYVERYGFPSDCKVAAFTGDNPASLAGMRLGHGDIVVSLGTSDTLFLWIDKACPQLMGHVFVNPVDEDAYMALLCYKNGSRTREKVRDKFAEGKWEVFNKLLEQTQPANAGNIGIYFTEPEITPAGLGEFRFSHSNEAMVSFPAEVEVRAILESQVMAKRCHAQRLGYHTSLDSRVLVTGGASQNTSIRQIIADVFNTDVYISTETANSASLGAAYIAKRVAMGGNVSFQEAVRGGPCYQLANSPCPGAKEIYEPLLARYAQLEATLSSTTSYMI